jgi:hypothetical protein
MFPEFQRFKSKLAEEMVNDVLWAPFIPFELTESVRKATLVDLMNSGPESFFKYSSNVGNISSPEQASQFYEEVVGINRSFKSLADHTRRSAKQNLRKYNSMCESMMIYFFKKPSRRLHELAKRHSIHAATLLEDIQNGDYNEGLIGELLGILEKSYVKALKTETPSLMESLIDHTSFVSALSKSAGVKVERWEGVREGVYLYLDSENTQKLASAVSDTYKYINNIADKHGYLLLRQGSMSDVEFGSFGENLSRWTFVHSPLTKDEGDGKLEILSKHKFKAIKSNDIPAAKEVKAILSEPIFNL